MEVGDRTGRSLMIRAGIQRPLRSYSTVQTIVENVYVWLVGPRRPVSER